jgi:hypothetical protein
MYNTIFTPATFTPSYDSVLVSSDVFFNNLFEPKKKVTVNFNYSSPLISVYETIDNNPEMRHKMVDYFYDLARDKWFLDDINDVLNYYKYSNGEVKIIENISEYSKNNIAKDTNKTAWEKVKYMTKTTFDKYTMKDILKTFVKNTNTKWVDLPKNKYYVMKFTKEYILKKIMRELKK